MRALIAALLVVVVFAGAAGGPALAQERIEVAQARTLFDLLFGPKETAPPPATTRTNPAHPGRPRQPPTWWFEKSSTRMKTPPGWRYLAIRWRLTWPGR